MIFQLLLGSVMLLSAVVIVTVGDVHHPAVLAAGFAVTFLATALSLVVPWDRLPRWAHAMIPALDFIAIGLFRESSDVGGLGLLWALVAMWAAWSFGIIGTAISVTAISVTYWWLNLLAPEPIAAGVAVIFPLIIGVLAVITLVMAQRADGQRTLLERQSHALQQAATRAREQENLLAGVLDAVDFGVVRFDSDGVTTVTNETHHTLQQTRDCAAAAVYRADGVTPLELDDLPLARARRGETFDSELVWYGEPGGAGRRALQATARRVTDPSGADVGGIMVSRDATAEQLALRAREDLIASVSHELRTPLTSILGYLELALDDEALTAPTRRGLQVAERNAGRLLELIAEVLTASADSRLGIEVRIAPQPAEVSEPVLAAIEAAQPRARARGMTIDGAGVEHARANVDLPRVRQVIDNLLGNAVKYGNGDGRIDVGCTDDGDHVWIAVRDDGPGIAAEDIPRLFERFYRSERVRKTSIHGSGLGLAISRDIVRAHRGDILVRSEPGSGSTFLVRLPSLATEPGA